MISHDAQAVPSGRKARKRTETCSERPFEIELASTGEVIEVRSGQSAADALRQIGVEIPVSCGDGTCGACVTGVLDGTPVHRDGFLTREERAQNAQFTPCCSRGVERLVIDL